MALTFEKTHPAHAVLDLQEKVYDRHSIDIDRLIKENDELVGELSDVSRLMSLIQARKDDLVDIPNPSKKKSFNPFSRGEAPTQKGILFSSDEERQLIDRIHAKSPYLFDSKNRYECQKDKIEGLLEGLNNETRTIGVKLNPKFMEMSDKKRRQNEIDQLISDIMRVLREADSKYVNAQRKS
jgi:hypothetical protein